MSKIKYFSENLDVQNKTIILRLDFNVPLKEKIDDLGIDEIEQKISDNLTNFKEIELEYFVIADEKNLKPIKHKQAEKCRAFIAACVSGVRLIDNVKLY